MLGAYLPAASRRLPLHYLLLWAVVLAAATHYPDSARAGTGDAPVMTPSSYEGEIEAWRTKRAERLSSDDGWLAVAGLFWLAPGENAFGAAATNTIVLPQSVPAVAGAFHLDETTGKVRVIAAPGAPLTSAGKPVEEMVLKSDADGEPDVLALNDVRMFVIKRTKGTAVRMRHLNAPARKNFAGLDYFPIDASWRIEARFVPYDPPKPVLIANVVGTSDTMLAPGFVEFTRDGRTHRLEPMRESPESDELFFIFKDETSRAETYPPGRFLYSPAPADGKVVLDFNKAYNPPCAFTDWATCPLPPPQNHLKLRVEAGEKRYALHAHGHD